MTKQHVTDYVYKQLGLNQFTKQEMFQNCSIFHCLVISLAIFFIYILPSIDTTSLIFQIKQTKSISRHQNHKSNFLSFPACFSIPIFFANLNYNCFNLLDLRNLQDCSDLSLFEQIVQVAFSKFLAFSPEFQKFFSINRTIFSHRRSEQFWWQNAFLTCSRRFLRSNKLKQL